MATANLEVEKERMRSRFEENHLEQLLNDVPGKNCLFTQAQYEETVAELLRLKDDGLAKQKENPAAYAREYRLVSRFDLGRAGGTNLLVEKKIRPTAENGNPRIYIHSGQLFDRLWEAHQMSGHKGRDIMHHQMSKRYANVGKSSCIALVNVCEACQLKRKTARKGLVIKPIVSPDMNSRGQVDLIDYQSMPDGDFKYVMVYQDNLTKFCVLRPLKKKTAAAVATELISIFSTMGAPHILQSDNGEVCVCQAAITYRYIQLHSTVLYVVLLQSELSFITL